MIGISTKTTSSKASSYSKPEMKKLRRNEQTGRINVTERGLTSEQTC